jgi:hypothetical protein
VGTVPSAASQRRFDRAGLEKRNGEVAVRLGSSGGSLRGVSDIMTIPPLRVRTLFAVMLTGAVAFVNSLQPEINHSILKKYET